MARPLNEQEHAAKRQKILAAAQRFIYTKGFERLTIQELIKELGISKGAFFHYFSSKSDLLEAIIDQMTAEILNHLNAIVADATLNAQQKLEKYFQAALRWKTERREFLIAILRAWHLDENAVVRQKVFAKGVEQLTPILTQLIEQGNQEGCWKVSQAAAVARMSIYLLQGLSDTLAQQLLAPAPTLDRLWLEDTLRAYTEAMERLLGMQPGCLTLLDPDALALWFLPASNQTAESPASQNSRLQTSTLPGKEYAA